MTDPSSCPPTREVDLLCTQLNKAETERDAAKAEADRLVALGDQMLTSVRRERDELRAEVEDLERGVSDEQDLRLQSNMQVDQLRAVVDAVRALLPDIEEWVMEFDVTQDVAVKAFAPLYAALAAGGSLVGPKPQPDTEDEPDRCVKCGHFPPCNCDMRLAFYPSAAAGPVVAEPKPQDEHECEFAGCQDCNGTCCGEVGASCHAPKWGREWHPEHGAGPVVALPEPEERGKQDAHSYERPGEQRCDDE